MLSFQFSSIGPSLVIIVFLEFYSQLPLTGFGSSAEMYYDTTLQEAFSRGLKCHPKELSKTGKFVRLIAKYLHEDYNSIFYGKAQNLGRVLCKAYDKALEKYDVLILPTIPKKAPVFPQENPSLKGEIFSGGSGLHCRTFFFFLGGGGGGGGGG